jgi:hypothetical protein
MNRVLKFDLRDSDQREIFALLIQTLNASGVTWGIQYDTCTDLIDIEIGEGY